MSDLNSSLQKPVLTWFLEVELLLSTGYGGNLGESQVRHLNVRGVPILLSMYLQYACYR